MEVLLDSDILSRGNLVAMIYISAEFPWMAYGITSAHAK